MKTLTKILTIVAVVLTASCSYEEMADKLIPKEESQFAKDYLHKLQIREFAYVKQYIDPSIQSQVTDKKLIEAADYFPSGELISAELIGSQVNVFNSQWQGNFSFEYQFSGGWALANVVLKKSGEELSVLGLNVYRTEASQKEINKFSLVGKSTLQYFVLFLAIAIPLFIVVTAYFCFRTPIPKRKWLWVLFVSVGIGSISVNWTTGQFGVQLLSIWLFSASAMAAGPFAPWIISAYIPLGAILFWFKRRGFIQASKANSERSGLLKKAIAIKPKIENVSKDAKWEKINDDLVDAIIKSNTHPQIGIDRIKEILAEGININAKSENGRTVLSIANYYEVPSVIKALLINAGAKE